jgi:rhamnosyltransferase
MLPDSIVCVEHEKSPAVAGDSVCAIVVAYFPDEEFEARIRELLPQIARVVIVDNTPGDSITPRLQERFQNTAQVQLIENRANPGISVALNQGLEYALKAGYKWILTLDQDTQCYSDMVHTLLRVTNICEWNPAVVGGNYLDPRNKGPIVPTRGAESFLEQKTVITSGCLIDAAAAKAIGGFREDYFIDQVDHEFCLRMRAHGHRVVISRKAVMNHSVGTSGGASLPFLGVLPNHPPLRKYYITRNTIVTVADYWRREPAWCLRRLGRLLLGLWLMALLEEDRFDKVRAFTCGIADGLRRRMGPCTRESIYRSRANKKISRC